jgi:hypothetical protein
MSWDLNPQRAYMCTRAGRSHPYLQALHDTGQIYIAVGTCGLQSLVVFAFSYNAILPQVLSCKFTDPLKNGRAAS